eukprot:c22375_g2_i1 orf=562-4569(+)
MSDPVELILAFLQRHQFAKAEAALKAELLTRKDGGRVLSPSESFPDWDLQLHSRRNPQSSDGVVSTADEETAMLPFDKNNLRGSSNKEDTFIGISREEVRPPPEKQLYVEYEPGKPGFQDSFSTASQEFAFEEVKTLPEPEASVHLTAGDHVSLLIQDVDNALQGASWMPSFLQGEGSLPGARSSNSAEPLLAGTTVRQVKIEPAEHASKRCTEGMHQPQQLTSMAISSKSQYHAQQQESHIHVSQKEFVSHESKVPRNTYACANGKEESEEGEKSILPSNLNEDKASRSNLIAGGELAEASTDRVEHCRELCLQVQNVLLTDPPSEGTYKDPSLKTFSPLAVLKPSQNAEQQRLLMPEFDSLSNGKSANEWVRDNDDAEQVSARAIGGGGPVLRPHSENLELNSISFHESGELPRLPPVRLHSIDKNMDIFKKDGLYTDNENATRSHELKALESVGGVTEDDKSGWGTVLDCPVGQELPTSGSKRPVYRLSVSHGIVEALSEQLSGFANVADGQNEGWYRDEYCDSDTYEDDDDPGYHRQPIEDEEWFLANEIDYPSDDERSRQHTDKITLTNTKQSRKVDEDDRSFGEEESYFSGEEYYRLQAAKKEFYKSQQSELRNLADQNRTTTNLYAPQTDNDPLTLPGVDNGGDESENQTFVTDELMRIRPQRVWKGLMGQANELDQNDVDFDGYRVDATCAEGIDDDNHGSVRSGGIFVSSDVADVGSEVRDSLLGGSSEGDTESFRDQELVTYEPASRNIDSQEFHFNEKQEHMEVRSASVQHIKEDDNKHDMVLQYYNEAWGLCKRATERELASLSTLESKVSSKELSKNKHLTNCNNKGKVDNGGSMFEGFSFPSPSSTNDVAVSTAGSGKSLWSNRESTAQGDETDGYVSGMVGPDDTLAAWKRKSNNSSPIICSSEENLQKFDMPNHSMGFFRSTDDYVSLEAKEHNIPESDVGQLPKMCQPLIQEDEDALAGQEEIRTLGADEDQFEIFSLRIIHRKNRTGFEEDKEFPVMINSVVAGRYHVTEYLGSAAFSKAIQAHDLHTGMDVCMKIIKNNKDFFDQSLDEIKLLKFVNKHDPVDKYHILRLYDYFYHREHLFIVCELLRANLYEFHKFNRESGGEVYFTMPRLQSITRQCLEALEFLHRLGIIHCDLKPENILVKSYSRCEIKIIDLGSSCFQTDHLCSYVQSRSYRAPEVILGLAYDQKIDIWSLGCILAELCTGNVLFQNDSLATLLARVVGILGPIDPEVLAKGRDTYKYFTKNHMLYERNQETDQLEYLLPKRTSLSHRLPMGDQGFVEFVRYLLQSNPAKRPIATEALQHPWLSHPYEPISS